MDYNYDLDDERYLWADEILSLIEERDRLEMEEEEEELLEIE